ncbi:hypothetical protein ACWKWU_02155 [Chitinophaga lutea]
MRRFILALTALLMSSVAFAQVETLTGKSGGFRNVAAYGTAVGKVSTFDGQFAVFTGAYGGVFLNKKFLLGAGGYGLATRHRPDGHSDRSWGFWYTGAVFEYVHNSDKLFHWSAGALLGGGSISERESFQKGRDRVYASSGVFVAEPWVQAEMNVTKYLRVVAGGSYRQTLGAGGVAISNGDLSGPSFQLGVKAGIF